MVGIVNVVGSSIARETDCGIYMHAGPEIGVASTKAFTCQVSILVLLSLYIAQKKKIDKVKEINKILNDLQLIPDIISNILDLHDEIMLSHDDFSFTLNSP